MIKDELHEVQWQSRSKEWYQNLGYEYTHCGDKFFVHTNELSPGSSARITIICDICGSEFNSQYKSHKYNKQISKYKEDLCCQCASRKGRNIKHNERIDNAFELAQQFADEKGYIILTKKKDIYGSNKNIAKIKYNCPKHGDQECLIDNFIKGHGCYYCGREAVGEKLQKYSTENIKQAVDSINNNILLNPEDYVDINTANLKIQCSCGRIFTASAYDYFSEKIHKNRCSHCQHSESIGEYKVHKYLEMHNISMKKQKTFPDCIDKRMLPFDFYLPEYNTIIEYDGLGHYKPVYGEKSFQSTVEHDKIKNKYCHDHGINLIRIPYYELQNINKFLDDALKNIVYK